MKNLTGNEIRSLFLKYFKERGHMIEPGASLVPHNDPTLLWINAGVAALKKYFDGSIKPESPRIVNAQKSIRTNDIENVGKTARHHTFFEMLGNFSIGDYFKREAIPFAWEFLTSPEYIGFDKEKMYITVYADDEEAYKIWTEDLHVDPSHILKTPNNFWQIGEGPCGPDTEIFYDRGPAFDPQNIGERLFFEELENDRYIEIWNVVFSQYDGKEGVDRKDYKELPQRNIDTGMGLERLTCIVQNGETNFDTDLFLPLIHACEAYSSIKYQDNKMAYRVIADHIRTVTFALADGALFANEGRGYVLRRVLRRAVRFGRKLKIEGSFMYRLVPVVYDIMKEFYPYLGDKIEYIQKLVKAEEERFHATLSDGEKLLQDVISKTQGNIIDGMTAFKLYDTYGFPLELTIEIAEEQGFDIDRDGFDQEMSKQRKMAKEARSDVQSMSSQSADLMDFVAPSTFAGYDKFEGQAKVIGLFKDGERVDQLVDEGEVVLDESLFYAEMGGQVGDEGWMSNDHVSLIVSDVHQAPHKQHLQHVIIQSGRLQEGDIVFQKIDEQKRLKITCNHSATHLLQSALKQVVGNHIAQAGSFVSDEYLRFDFTHYEKVSDASLMEIESIVNQFIFEHHEVNIKNMGIKEAKESGATALFDEKYGSVVRVVSMGDVSMELCGGCHVHNTQQIGICKIVSEESIGSGIRRITAKTGIAAYQEFHQEENTLKQISEMLKMKSLHQVDVKVAQLLEEEANLRKENAILNNQIHMAEANMLKNEIKEINQMHILVKELDHVDGGALKEMAASLKNSYNNCVIFLASTNGTNVVFACAADETAIKNGIHCGKLVKDAANLCDGNGGGRPDLAQAGGKNIAKLGDAMQHIENKLGFTL
ncbi:MAG: alanine--tRNA ligase [Erysipelotrichaceae bacterium]